MEAPELRRLIVRHRHVAPMLSVLLASTDARVTITSVDGEVILDRTLGGQSVTPSEHHPIVVEGMTIGWVDGPRPSGAIAAVLSYACARETDKRALAREALDRYRELSLIYDLADRIGGRLELEAVAEVAADEAGRLPTGGTGFVILRGHPGADDLRVGILHSVDTGEAEIVNDIAADPRASKADQAWASVVAVPLIASGERLGVIGTRSTSAVEYHASDLKVLVAIASLTAPTLRQAAEYESALREA
jgi:GAF domain